MKSNKKPGALEMLFGILVYFVLPMIIPYQYKYARLIGLAIIIFGVIRMATNKKIITPEGPLDSKLNQSDKTQFQGSNRQLLTWLLISLIGLVVIGIPVLIIWIIIDGGGI